ncbi:TetR/AcrR family transcriptional regulator [Anaerovorax sp. IOR16]|uniref:TetR/AcrR family transcriptional regulator n=1 Tax=Anaerovorax sp. IOR16 TaxID=2773458 RepID=UPI0019D19CEE|nr:TetR/AcrR family transcriptional regulator [Anaerovorax sp. IOR16]
MAKQIEGVGDRLLLFAKKEFLEKGYKDASLRTIAENANTSTGSIYTRFKDKAGLFNEIVKSTADGFENKFREEIAIFDKMPQMPWEEMLEYTDNQQFKMIDKIYDDFDSFKLLVCCAEGTIFSEFIHNIVEFHVEYTIKYIESIGNDAITSKRLTPELLHILCSSYWSGFFEIVVHNMSKKDAYQYICQLKRFFRCGWKDIFSATS